MTNTSQSQNVAIAQYLYFCDLMHVSSFCIYSYSIICSEYSIIGCDVECVCV